MSLIHMALAFVANHPAVTAAIIGPRTMEQLESQLAAPSAAQRRGPRPHRRDRPAGNERQRADTGWDPPWLADGSLRRR